MAIIKKKDGRERPYFWSLSTGIKLPNGKYKYINSEKGFASPNDAKDDEAIARAALKNGTYTEPTKTTLKEYIEKTYLVLKGNLKSYKTTKHHLDRFVGYDDYGCIKLCDLRPIHFAKYKSYMESLGLEQKTVREELSAVKSAFNYAVDELEILGKNPAKKTKLPPKTKAKGIHLEPAVMWDQLQKIKKYDYEIYIPLLIMATAGGGRTAEAIGVLETNLNFKNMTVKIDNALDYVDGVLQLTGLKTDAGYRVAPLLPIAKNEIKEWIKYRNDKMKEAITVINKETGEKTIDLTRWKNDLGLLWCACDDGRPMSQDFLQRRYRKLKKEHKDLIQMRAYDFRHSYAAGLRFVGVPMADISDLMGHTDLAFTAKTYALPINKIHPEVALKLQNAMLNV